MSRKAAGRAQHRRQRTQRVATNLFASLGQEQIEEFKEAFKLIDQDGDGFISKQDLREMFQQLGTGPSETELDDMLREAPGPINFTMFLTMIGARFGASDPEETILKAFSCLDTERTGYVHKKHLAKMLTEMGDRMTKEEVHL